MKRYKLQYDKRFQKDLEKIPKQYRKNICEKIEALSIDPRPEGSIKLSGSKKDPLFRIRCGDYRVVYTIRDEILLVIVVELGHRKMIYRGL